MQLICCDLNPEQPNFQVFHLPSAQNSLWYCEVFAAIFTTLLKMVLTANVSQLFCNMFHNKFSQYFLTICFTTKEHLQPLFFKYSKNNMIIQLNLTKPHYSGKRNNSDLLKILTYQ